MNISLPKMNRIKQCWNEIHFKYQYSHSHYIKLQNIISGRIEMRNEQTTKTMKMNEEKNGYNNNNNNKLGN